jgi:3-hydroxymyristoyl/3-hydroxydecanoyl-(acyl carrier protein) dehydratase
VARAERRVSITADHPALPGHFPGDPLVPGVVLLDLVIDVAGVLAPGMTCLALPSVKFKAPVRPDATLLVRCEAIAPGRIRFACEAAGQVAVEGRLVFGPPAGPSGARPLTPAAAAAGS